MVQVARAALLIIVTLAVSCSQHSPVEPVPTPTPTPIPTITTTLLLERAASQMSGLQSLRFKLTHPEGSTLILDGLQAHTVHGDVALPDQADLKVEASALGFFVNMRLVISDDKAFMTDPLSNAWYTLSPAELPFNFLDLGTTLATIAGTMQNPNLKNNDTSRLYTITGTLNRSNLSLLIPETNTEAEVLTELIVDENGFIREVMLIGPIVSSDTPSITRVIEFSNFNTPVEVTLPK